MAGENPRFVEFVRGMECAISDLSLCDGRIEAHHAGPRGLGQRAHDETCVPLCTKHHRAWHDASGVFKSWKREARREWIQVAMARVQALWLEKERR